MITIQLLFGAFFVFIFSIRVLKAIFDPARNIPGPIWCRFSRFWLLKTMLKGRPHEDIARLHTKHGNIVRIAPEMYSISEMGLVKEIYGIRTAFEKSDFYASFTKPGDVTIFTNRSNANFQKMKRIYASSYGMTMVLRYEPEVNTCLQLFLDQISRLDGQTCDDMINRVQLYLTETLAAVTVGERLGALEKGKDKHDINRLTWLSEAYGAIVGIYPKLHPWLWMLIPKGQSEKGARDFASTRVMDRAANFHPEAESHCFVDAWLHRAHEDNEKITFKDMMTGVGANMDGGHTTGHSIIAILFLLDRNPRVLQKLRKDLHDAVRGSTDNEREALVSYSVLHGVSYLHDVIKEAIRLYPVIAFIMPRRVPAGGRVLDGHLIPENSTVGVHLYHAGRDKQHFGGNADDFYPERWQEDNKLKDSEFLNMMFSIGPRGCIGKHIAMLIMSKLLAEIILRFDLNVLFPSTKDLRVWGIFVPMAEEFVCEVKKRNAAI